MQSKDLLIIPEGEGSLDGLELALSQEGHRVTTVDSQEALEKTAKHRFDLAFVELRGTTDAELIRDMGEVSSGMAVLGVVDQATTDLIIRAHRCGADDFVMKTYSPQELGSALQRALQRRATALERGELERRYRTLIENANDAIYTLAINGIFTYANRKTEEIAGRSREELIGTTFIDLFTLECRNRMNDQFQEYLTSDLPHSFEIEIHNRDGQEVSLEVNTTPIMVDGEVIGVQGIARNVTERRRLERKIAESEERYRSLVESTKDGIVTFDEKGNFTSLNKAAESIFGYKANELLGEALITFLPSKEADIGRSHIHSVLRNGPAPLARLTFNTKGGDERVCEFSSLPLEREKRKLGIVSVVRDITDRVRGEEDIRSATALWERILSSAGDLIMVTDEEGVLIYFNPAAERAIGYRRAEVLGTFLSQMYMDSAQLEAMLEELGRGKEKVIKVVKFKTKDERILSLLMTASPLRDEGGKICGWVWVSKDITILREKRKSGE